LIDKKQLQFQIVQKYKKNTISTFANALSLSLSLAFSFALTAGLKSYTKINRRQIEFHPLQQKNNKICFLNWL